MKLKSLLKKGLERAGIEVHRYPAASNPSHVRRRLFDHLGINLVLDVGANAGQYAGGLYENGYRGRCVSFEPVSGIFKALADRASGRSEWTCEPFALGAEDGETTIHVNDTMSSILPRSGQASHAIQFGNGQTETIHVRRLDAVASQYIRPDDRTWLKMDVQGFELMVLRGAAATLPSILAVEAEMSVWPFYSGQPLYRELVDHMDAAGFDLWSISPGHRVPETGRMIEMDGIFVNRTLAKSE